MDYFFTPSSVAIFGSMKKGGVGYELLRNIMAGGFKGNVFPINPRGGSVERLKVYPSIMQVESEIDLSVIAVPADRVKDALEGSGKKGIKAALVISSGFSEVGNLEGERELKKIAVKHGMRIIGPNCAGISNPHHKFYPTIELRTKPGNFSFMTQSGAFGGAFIAGAKKERIGLSKFVSYGNECDVSEHEILEWLERDSETSAIGVYIEGLKDGLQFFKQAKNSKKPVIAIKAGRTEAGRRGASSHTSALAGRDEIYRGAFKQAGMFKVKSLDEMLDAAKALSFCDRTFPETFPKGKKIGIVTNSGGPGILAADECSENELDVGETSQSLKDKLKKVLPPICSLNNPIDLTAQGTGEQYEAVILLLSKEYDSILCICIPPAYIGSEGPAKGILAGIKKVKVPVLVSMMAGELVQEGIKILHKEKVPNFESGERAAKAIAALTWLSGRSKWKKD
jgi:acyl-CoA synthetase (NDP forming)